MNTKEKIAVMQAFDEGRAIEHCRVVIGPQLWLDCYEPTWDWQTFEYRVKRQPKTVTVEYWESESGNIELTREGSTSSVNRHKDDSCRLIASIELRE
jgi:hypothetical protein